VKGKADIKQYTMYVHGQKGVGMIEVLVTLFVLSVGLLGVASLQFVGSFSNKDALSRSHAVMVAQQMTERLRANIVPSSSSDGFVVSNEYFNPDNYNFTNLSCSGSDLFSCHCNSTPVSVPDCHTNVCTVDQSAQFDAYQMSCAAIEANPNTTIEVSCTDNNALDSEACSAGSVHQIMVSWPSVGWLDDNRIANSNCNANGGNDQDCVLLKVAL